MTLSLKQSLAFLFGFGFAFLPTLGPLFASFFFLAGRWTFRKVDVVWVGTALLSAFSFASHSGLQGAIFGFFQILGPWFVFSVFRQFSEQGSKQFSASYVGLGLVTGLMLVVFSALIQVEAFSFSYKTLSQALIWGKSPALYGHSVFVLGSLIAIVSSKSIFRLSGLGLSALGILLSGSREAALAWLIISLFLLFLSYSRRVLRLWLIEVVLFALMLLLSIGVGRTLGWGEIGFLLDVVPSSQSVNMVQGSEIAYGDWWDDSWVSYIATNQEIDDQSFTVFTVQKRGSESWHRLQQVIPLETNKVYTMSVWLDSSAQNQEPGLQGWGKAEDGTTFALVSALQTDVWYSRVEGPGTILDAGIAEESGLWRRVFVTFHYQGETSPLYWYVGMAPDNRTSFQSKTRFAGFQIEPDGLSAYVPGTVTRGLSFALARQPYWQAAWQGVKEKPLLGWGRDTFTEIYKQANLDSQKLRTIPAHAHNLYLQTWLERGVLGLLVLGLLIILLSFQALKRRDSLFLVVLALLLGINIFDISFFYGSIIYPVAAIAGWRSVSAEKLQNQTKLRRLFVNLTLILTDFLASYGLFILLSLLPITNSVDFWNREMMLAFLLIPLLIWRSGLYPGYGLAASQELRRHVISIFYAVVIIAMGRIIFQEVFSFPLRLILIFAPLSILSLPLARYVCKYFLAKTIYWGDQVIILGASSSGKKVARALLANPLGGLRPVAFFDNKIEKNTEVMKGIYVEGPLHELEAYAKRNGLGQLIITIAQPPEALITQVTTLQNQTFKKVQIIPDIPGLPVQGISAGSVDRLLAIEVPVRLASTFNRLVKRLFDLLLVIAGGICISPFLLIIALAIYLDSPGPVFFGHKRIGQDGKSFKAWKFRTMVVDAETKLEHYLKENPNLRLEWEVSRKLQNDPRVTRAGIFLRKYSLDEFPQLWNVLLGEMSLVGPRPIIQDEVAYYDKTIELYKLVKPGLTGFWQVSGRSDTDYAYRVDLDSFYVRNWSIWLDIVILAQTPLVVVKGEGAY